MSDAAAASAPADLARVFHEQRRFLFGLCYRMTGSAADADDLVQETFARALASPPARTHEPWRPWLVRVAVNLSRDELRRRKRRAYKGPWLPEPVDDAQVFEARHEPAHEPASTAGRYELVESVSFAFLLALEALTPVQRAVLLLRDVLEYSGSETAAALDLSGANVRVVHHRARAAMAAYDASRRPPSRALTEQTLDVMGRFMRSFGAHDVAGMEALLAEDVVTLNDTNGRYPAAGVAVTGRNKVARFHAGIASLRARLPRIEVRWLNGGPAIIGSYDEPITDRFAPAFITLGELDAHGRIRRIYTLLNPDKIARFIPSGTGAPG
ncbi:MAG: sigma-70 family RNA polymerase sigma factor [Myxococcota bacterium]